MENGTGGGVLELLGPLLENPKLLQGALGMLGSLSSQGRSEDTESERASEAQSDAARRRALLCALKPYFSPSRAQKVEIVLRLLDLLEVLERNGAHAREGEIE